MFDCERFDIGDKLRTPLRPNPVLQNPAIGAGGVLADSHWHLLLQVTVDHRADRDGVELLLRVIGVNPDAKMLDGPLRVRTSRQFRDASDKHGLQPAVLHPAELPNVWPFLPPSESQISVLVSCLHVSSFQNEVFMRHGWRFDCSLELIQASSVVARYLQNFPTFSAGTSPQFIVSVLSIAVVTLLAASSRSGVQQHGSQSLVGPSAAQLSAKALDDLYRTVDSRMTDETEGIVRKAVSEFLLASERETFLVRIVTIGWIIWDFEVLWYNIYRSQIELLQRLNAGPLTRKDALPYYSVASLTYPHYYISYSFEQWLGYVRGNLLIREDGDKLSITIKGRAFLKHLIDTGRSASDRTA